MSMNQQVYFSSLSSLDRLVSKLKPQTSSKTKSSIVALFTSSPLHPLRYSGEICLLHLDYDRLLKNYLFRLYQLETMVLVFQAELYYGFGENYRKLGQGLWGFDLGEGTVSFLFRNQEEGQGFAKKIEIIAPKRQALLELSKKQVQQQLKRKKQNSIFGKLKSKLFGKPSPQVPKQSIVVEVKKSNSVRFDQHGNVISESLSPEWQDIIRKSGLRASDLKRPQIAKIVLEQTIVFQLKKAAEKDPQYLQSAGIKCIQQLQQAEEKEQNAQRQAKIQQNNVKEDTTLENKSMEEAKQANTESIPVSPILNLTLPPLLNNNSPILNLPIPPPLFDLPPPLPLPQYRSSALRDNLLSQFRNNNIKLKPIQTNANKGLQIDASALNKDQREDLASLIRQRLKKRKAALNRRHSSSEQD